MKGDKPNCYNCVHRLTIPGDAHTRCNNHGANISGELYGMQQGWFNWPINFDPVWLTACDGFSDKPEGKTEQKESDPLTTITAMLK